VGRPENSPRLFPVGEFGVTASSMSGSAHFRGDGGERGRSGQVNNPHLVVTVEDLAGAMMLVTRMPVERGLGRSNPWSPGVHVLFDGGKAA